MIHSDGVRRFVDVGVVVVWLGVGPCKTCVIVAVVYSDGDDDDDLVDRMAKTLQH